MLYHVYITAPKISSLDYFLTTNFKASIFTIRELQESDPENFSNWHLSLMPQISISTEENPCFHTHQLSFEANWEFTSTPLRFENLLINSKVINLQDFNKIQIPYEIWESRYFNLYYNSTKGKKIPIGHKIKDSQEKLKQNFYDKISPLITINKDEYYPSRETQILKR